MAAALHRSADFVFGHPEYRLNDTEQALFAAVIDRRLEREPVSRILGWREFWSLPIKLNAATLDPRPDSETLIEAILELRVERNRPYRILDLGTGSGCLLAALLTEYPDASGVAVDISAASIDMASENFRNLGLADRTTAVVGDWQAASGQNFDIVVSNPPYIAEPHISGLEPEVSAFDPPGALAAGTDGLDAYRALGPTIHDYLDAGALAVVELGAGQYHAVSDLFETSGLHIEGSKTDLAGHERCIICSRAKDLPSD